MRHRSRTDRKAFVQYKGMQGEDPADTRWFRTDPNQFDGTEDLSLSPEVRKRAIEDLQRLGLLDTAEPLPLSEPPEAY